MDNVKKIHNCKIKNKTIDNVQKFNNCKNS
jgi:hypothetical protein